MHPHVVGGFRHRGKRPPGLQHPEGLWMHANTTRKKQKKKKKKKNDECQHMEVDKCQHTEEKEEEENVEEK